MLIFLLITFASTVIVFVMLRHRSDLKPIVLSNNFEEIYFSYNRGSGGLPEPETMKTEISNRTLVETTVIISEHPKTRVYTLAPEEQNELRVILQAFMNSSGRALNDNELPHCVKHVCSDYPHGSGVTIRSRNRTWTIDFDYYAYDQDTYSRLVQNIETLRTRLSANQN